ncbi:hypothetical protein Taro_028646 [Colocasia esculenta]|uniref:Uncharacterized protein n=1 Tax=Colocasia esculenta TaxID=4460 RepID=A0A843VJ55_COLES|nr:hypothetical protein [Colocasia esculenta]
MLTLEAPTEQETLQPEEDLFWGQEPTKHKKKNRRSRKKKAVATLSCNTISSLLGLVEHHDEEEIYSPCNDVNQVGASGAKFITRSRRKWGCSPPANQNIIFRREPSYQIPEPRVRVVQVPPPPGLYTDEEAGGTIPSFAKFLAAEKQTKTRPIPLIAQEKGKHKQISPTGEIQARNDANDKEELKLDDVKGDSRIVKLVKKIPTRFSVWEILSLGEETRKALITALQTLVQYEACLAEMQVEAVVANVESITFTPEDMLLPMTTHNRPLYMRGQLNGLPLNRILVDPGAAVNILTYKIYQKYHFNVHLTTVHDGLAKPVVQINCQTVRALKTMVIFHPCGRFTIFYVAEEQPMRRDDDCKIPEETGDPLVPIMGFSDMSNTVTRLAKRQQIPLCQRLSQREMFRKLWYPPNMDRELLKITQHPGLGLSLGGSYTVGMISIANQAEKSPSRVVYDDYPEERDTAKTATYTSDEPP